MWNSRTTTDPVTVRHAWPADLSLVATLLDGLSDQTRYLRYGQMLPRSTAWAWAEADRMLRRHGRGAMTLVATTQTQRLPEVIGVGELVWNAAAAHGEIALLVRDDQQGRGVGTALGRRLITMAQARRITELHAHLLPENRASLRLLRRLDVPYTTTFDGDLIQVVLQLAAPAERSVPSVSAYGLEASAPSDWTQLP